MMRSHHRFAVAALLVTFAACSSDVGTEDGRDNPDPACTTGCSDAGTEGSTMPGAGGSAGDSGSLPPVPSDDLIGHWKLDETSGSTASDASGFDRAATITGGMWAPGLADGSLLFDGAGDSMMVSDFAYGPELTLAFWFEIAENSGSVVQYLFNHGEQSQPNSVRVFLFRDGDTTGNAGKLRTIVRDADDGDDVELDVPSGLADGAWHLYTLAISPSSGSKVYVDGIERASADVGGDAIDPATPLYFGARADQEADRFLDGGLDDVRLYDRALSPGEIAALFAAQDPGPPFEPPPEQPPTGGAIDAADILHEAQAEVPFAQHSGYSGQVIGSYPSCKSIPEYPGGIMGSQLPNGETIRMGKVQDPQDSSKKVFVFQLSPNDPSTSGSKRCEFSFSKNVALDEVYWVALSVYVHDWGSLASNDKSLFGMQLHAGDNSLGLSPSVSINTAGSDNRSFEVQGRYQTSLGSKPSQSNSSTARSDQYPIAFGQWMDFVLEFKLSLGNDGFLRAWYDGKLIYDYQGRLGFETPGYLDYIKFGYYNWSSGFDSPRKILLRSPMLVRDPTGNKYAPEDLRAYVQQH